MFSAVASNQSCFFSSEPSRPRVEDLHAQRSYLMTNLQQEIFKATELLRKLPASEETLTRSQTFTARRRARKHIEWLKYQINETTRQESTILNRLSQLAQEIASRERQDRVENEQQRYGANISSLVVPGDEMQQVCFSPMTKQPHLQEYTFPYVSASPQQYESSEFAWRQSFSDRISDMPSEIFAPTTPHTTQFPGWISDLNAQTTVFAPATSNVLSQRHRSSSMNSLDVKLLSTKTPLAQRATVKRHSTGCSEDIRIWSNGKEDESFGGDESSGRSQHSG